VSATLDATTTYAEHRSYVLSVLRRRCGWLDAIDQEAILHDAYTVLLEKEREGSLDVAAMRPQQIRAYLTQTALNKALDEGKRAGRRRSVALDEGGLEVPSAEPEAGELIARGIDAARLREIVAELPERQQTIVKLRFFYERTPEEVRGYLGITERAYRRDLERAMRTLADRFALVRDGTFCESRRSLILAFVAGIAGPNRTLQARRHLESCVGCARWAAELRATAQQAGALVPLPVLDEVAGGRGLHGIGRALEGMRERVADLLAGARDQAAGLVARTDPSSGSMLAGVRPGTAVAVVAGCLSVGSTATYCALEGLPGPARSLLGESAAQAPRKAPSGGGVKASRAGDRTARVRRPAPKKPAPRAERRTVQRAQAPRKRAPATRQEVAVQRQQPTAGEFGVEGGAGAAGAAPAPAPAPAPASGSGGGWGSEFGP
jgi:RNA polymerase sigma factor (sigma-70 family)